MLLEAIRDPLALEQQRPRKEPCSSPAGTLVHSSLWEKLNDPRNRASVVVENATLYAIGGAGDGTTELIRLGLTNPDFADDLTGWQTSFGGLGARTVNVISEDSPHPYVVEIKSTGAGGSGGVSTADKP